MSDISVGDLVVVIKPFPCCGDGRDVGRHFIVEEITPPSSVMGCSTCDESPNEFLAWDGLGSDSEGYELSCVKRVPPLSELDKIKEEVTA